MILLTNTMIIQPNMIPLRRKGTLLGATGFYSKRCTGIMQRLDLLITGGKSLYSLIIDQFTLHSKLK